jgi:hypothetical protein
MEDCVAISQLADWIAETPESIGARLAGAQAAQKQTRVTLGVMALISLMMLIVTYNAYLSFDSRWALELRDEPAESLESKNESGGSKKTMSDVLAEQALKDWASSLDVTISLIGIRVSVDEAPVLGTASLAVFSLWLLLLARRENYAIGFLLRDATQSHPAATKHSPDQRWLILHSLMANSLFMPFDSSISRVDSLNAQKSNVANAPSQGQCRLLGIALDFASRFFFWFPAAACAAVICVDRLSYFQPDPFARNSGPSGVDAPLFWVSLIVSLVCWIPLGVCCWKSSQYSRATQSVLREYRDKLRSDLVRKLPAAG